MDIMPEVKDDGINVYLDYGTYLTYEWEQCFEDGIIDEDTYDECMKLQEDLDNMPF